MNVKHAKILLEKINRLFQSMTMDDHISEIEKELMRNYVKSLYEEFLPDRNKTSSIIEPPKVVKEVPKKVVPPPPPPPIVERVVETPPPPPKVEPIRQPEPVVVQTPKPEPKPKVVETPPVVKVVPPPPPPKPVVKKPKISEELEELFESIVESS